MNIKMKKDSEIQDLTFCVTISTIKLCGGSGMTKMGRPKADNAKRKTINIRVSEETHRQVAKYAAEHNTTMTAVALRSLEEFLSKKQ